MGRVRAAGAAAVGPGGTALVVPVAVVLGFVVFTAMFAARTLGPSDGTVVTLSDRLIGTRLVLSDVLDPGSGLQAGDAVVAVAGMAVGRANLAPRTAGDTLTYTVQRDGHLIDVNVRLLPRWPGSTWIQRNWSALLLSALLLAMAVTAFRRRPGDPSARTLLAIAVVGGVGVLSFVLGAQVIDLVQGVDLWWCAAGEIALTLSWASWLLFVLVFPQPMGGRRVRTLVMGCAVVLAGTLLAFLPPALLTSPTPTVALWRLVGLSYGPGVVYPMSIVVIVLVRAVLLRRTEAAPSLRWVTVGFVLGGAGYLLVWFLPIQLVGAPLLSWNLVPLTFIPPVTGLGAAVLRFGLYDVKAVARRTVVYATVTAVVVVVYVAIVLLAGTL